MSLQPLESTLAAIQSGQRMHASPEPAEGRDQVRLFPEGSGSKWSLFTRRQTRSAHTASDPPTAEAVQGPELLLEQPASPKDFTNVEEQDPSPCRVPLDSIPETPKTRRETHHIPSPRNLAGSPGRPGILMQQRRNSTSLLDRTLKSPSILPERIDAEKARSIIEEKAAKLRAAKRPEKRVIQYDLPNQQMLVVADQSAHATRESVYLVGKYAREKAEKEKVRRRLLELYWRKGAIPAAKKDDARRALELDDIESAERIIEETETAMRHAARARAIAEIAALAVGKPLSPMFTPKIEEWRKRSTRRLLEKSTHSKYLDDAETPTSRFLVDTPGSHAGASASCFDGDTIEHAASDTPELQTPDAFRGGEVDVSNTKSDEIRGSQGSSPEAQTMHTEDQDRAERLKRLQSAMSTDAKVASKAKSSVMGGLQTEKISLNSRKLNEVPDVLLEKSTQVKTLNLRVNDLSSIPDKFCMRLLNLQEVDLGFNQLSSLPPTLGFLVNLCRLYVNENKLAGLPSSIGRLEKLEFLNLDKNNLCKLPPSMSQLSSLNQLSLKGNRTFTLPPQEVVDQDWGAIKEHLSKIHEDGIASRDILWRQLAHRQIKVSALFLALDVEGAKQVDQPTFEARMAWDLRFRMTKKELRHLWHILDADGDGFITHHEFLYQLRRPVADEEPDQPAQDQPAQDAQDRDHRHHHHPRPRHSKRHHETPPQGKT